MCSLANSDSDPDEMPYLCGISLGYTLFAMTKNNLQRKNTFFYVEIITCDPSVYKMDHRKFIASNQEEDSTRA